MSDPSRRRVSVVLFNLGGPDNLDAVRPFLFNLFNDRAIISLPQPLRWALAQFISRIRERTAKEIYRAMGGSSPLAKETERQRARLETELRSRMGWDVQVVVAMRYWKPFTTDAARAVEAFNADDVVLLPLYPQFSTTTTGSSVAAWGRTYRGRGQVRLVCCYPENEGFIEAYAQKIRATLGPDRSLDQLRLVFSAHGLPEQVIAAGDPYQSQVERTATRLAERLGAPDWRVSYQSRVGPLKWIGPSTIEVLETAGGEGRGVLVAPIAFVSEHSETLVELDLEYSELAHAAGVPLYLRSPTVGESPAFICSLADMAIEALAPGRGGASPCGAACPGRFIKCPLQSESGAR